MRIYIDITADEYRSLGDDWARLGDRLESKEFIGGVLGSVQRQRSELRLELLDFQAVDETWSGDDDIDNDAGVFSDIDSEVC